MSLHYFGMPVKTDINGVSDFRERDLFSNTMPLPSVEVPQENAPRMNHTLHRTNHHQIPKQREEFGVEFPQKGLPRTKTIVQPHYSTLLRPPDTLQRIEREKMKRKTRSDWDLSARSDDVLDSGLGTDPPSLETHYAESEIPKANSNFFGSIRHHGHYFSNTDLFHTTGLNYLKYSKASDLPTADENGRPHLSISGLSFSHDLRSSFDHIMLRSSKHLNTLQDISFELKGGDTMALMFTNELEVRTLLRLISGENPPSGRLRVEFNVNGHTLRPEQLAQRVAHVPIEDPPSVLTVDQYLRFSSAIRKPATNAFKVNNMIDQLIQTLALCPFRYSLIGDLGTTERQRVKVASQLLKDTDILICDNITRDMDIYDMAFLIDFLRDWAVKLKRIVILAIAPTTVEILHMMHKAAILASGRIVYMGPSEEMVPYFERINFPCPNYKNPCDYYVDLVTHDHLTSEAASESLNRIRLLAETWKRNRPKTAKPRIAIVSPRVNRPSVFEVMFALYRRNFWVFVGHPLQYLQEPLIALIISLFLGFLFFDLTKEKRAGINDRFGLITSLISIFPALIGLINIECVTFERSFIHRDIQLKYYGAVSNLVVKFFFDLPFAIFASISMVLPAIFLSGLHNSNSSYALCLVSTVLVCGVHLNLWRYVAWTCAYFCRLRVVATFTFCFIYGVSVLSSGLFVSARDLHPTVQIVRSISPTYWTAQILLESEFAGRSPVIEWLGIEAPKTSSELLIGCEKKNVLATKIKGIPIYTVSKCSKMPGASILAASGFPQQMTVKSNTTSAIHQEGLTNSNKAGILTLSANIYKALLILSGCYSLAILFMCIGATCNHRPEFKWKTYE